MMNKFVLGITGGVGSGKSTVLDYLAREHHARVIQADLVARELMEPGGSAYLAVVEAFGTEILQESGQIDRVKLGAIIFADEQAREHLNRMTHPLVREEVEHRIAESDRPLIVYESAIPKEAFMSELCDVIWFVHVPVETRILRLMASRGYSREKCEAIMASQLPDETFIAMADSTIENGGTVEETEKQLQMLLSSVIK